MMVMTMMGCKFSKIGAEGAMFRRTRLRPLLLQQIAAMRTWRRSANSKKSLLLEQKLSVLTNSQPKLLEQPQDDNDRMIGACPASPSFRIFFEDAARDAHQQQIGKSEALREADSPRDDAAPSKEKNVQKKVKRHIKSVIRKRREAVKKLLNVEACRCYHPPTSHAS